MSYNKELEIREDDSTEVRKTIYEAVKVELGYPIVDVEITDKMIDVLIKQSLTEMAKYELIKLAYTVDLLKIDGSGMVSSYKPIDLSLFPTKVSTIIDVLKPRSTGDLLFRSSDVSGIPMTMAIKSNGRGMNAHVDNLRVMNTIMNERVLATRLMAAFKDGKSFDHDKGRNILFYDPGFPPVYSATFEYIPQLELEDVGIVRSFSDAYNFLIKYTVALALITVGRARGKFIVNNYDSSASSGELISQGIAQRDELIRKVASAYSHYITD